MKFNFLVTLMVLSFSAVAEIPSAQLETKSDRIDMKLVQLEKKIKDISQTISLSAQAPKREVVVKDNSEEQLQSLNSSLVSFVKGLDARQLFIRHEIKRSFDKFLTSTNQWEELEGLSRNISFYSKAIPGLNVSAESKQYAVSEISKLSTEAKALMNLERGTETVQEVAGVENKELVQVGNDLLYLQNDIKTVRDDVAQLAVSTIQKQNATKVQQPADDIFTKSKVISLSIFFIGSVILGFVMRGKTSPRRTIVKKVVVTKKEQTESSSEQSTVLPPLPLEMGLTSTEMEEFLNYIDLPVIVTDAGNNCVWSNDSSRKNSINLAKYEQLKAEGLVDSLGYPVIINHGVLYRVSTTHIKNSSWDGQTVNLIQLVPHEYSQIEFSSIKNKSKFITDIKSQVKEKNNINALLVNTVDRFKYLFTQSNIDFDYLPLDEDAYLTMKKDDLDKYCRDVIYMINRLVLDSRQKHDLILEAKLNDNRLHLKFYLMNYNYSLRPEEQERLNNEFSALHSIENSLSAYQGRLSLRTLKGEISSLEIDLSFNLYPIGNSYSKSLNSETTV